jgi:hypothetical protein
MLRLEITAVSFGQKIVLAEHILLHTDLSSRTSLMGVVMNLMVRVPVAILPVKMLMTAALSVVMVFMVMAAALSGPAQHSLAFRSATACIAHSCYSSSIVID